jgi:hypothetical protein
MAGDYPRALGNIHTIQSPYFPNSFYPEADVLKAVIYFANCNYDAATIVVARFNKKFIPLKDGLEKVLKRFKGANQEEPFYKFLLAVREGKADLDPQIRPIVEIALSDRQLLRNIEYVKVLPLPQVAAELPQLEPRQPGRRLTEAGARSGGPPGRRAGALALPAQRRRAQRTLEER